MGRISFLPDSVAAALTAPILAILAFVYLPVGGGGCGGVHVDAPRITAGDQLLNIPETTALLIKRDGTKFVGVNWVPEKDLVDALKQVRQRHANRPLEIRADRRATMRVVNAAILAAREAGYSEYYVLGQWESPLTFRRS